jgi:uncharacterized SAM-binding protein YcdF (DUF218 family)
MILSTILRIIKKLIKYFLISLVIINLLVLIIPIFGGSCKSNSETNKYDVIIVLGAPASDDCKPSVVLQGRIDKGIELFKQGYSDKILFTGSSIYNSCTEADVMAEYAQLNGIPESSILRENRAENTYQNAFYSVEHMRNLNFTSAAIVTSEAHIRRSCAVFSKFDINYSMFAAKNPKGISKLNLLFWKFGERMILSHFIIFG